MSKKPKWVIEKEQAKLDDFRIQIAKLNEQKATIESL